MKFKVSKTYQVITPESAEIGDHADQGFEYENNEFTLRELLKEIENGGFVENSGRWLSTVDPERDYQTGEETFYNLHIETSERNYERICKLAKVQ